MNNKLPGYPKNSEALDIDDFIYQKNDSEQKAGGGLNVIDDNEKSPDNQIKKQLLELKLRNYNLEKLTKQLKIKLKEAVTIQNKNLSIIAHDLRSPFGVIIGALELIKIKMEDQNYAELENYIDMASDSAKRTLSLLDDLLDWIISQNSMKSFNPVKINLHELLEEEISSVVSLPKHRQLSINHYVLRDLNVTADAQMVKTIIRNLINNAMKYTDSGGEIKINAKESGQIVRIIVSNTGVGISQEAQKMLFKLEGMHSTTIVNKEHSSGLGLFICKEFVEMHGGTIYVKSQPGEGNKFIFTLPKGL